MEKIKKGFTLIELLVVVLIIGVLTAIALPQYQISVAKARIANLMPLLRSLAEQEEIYYMENGSYTDDISLLSINGEHKNTGWTYDYTGYYELPNGLKLSFGSLKEGMLRGGTADIHITFLLNHIGPSLLNDDRYKIYQESKIICAAKSSDPISIKVCQSMGGIFYTDTNCLFMEQNNNTQRCKQYRVY